VHAFALERVENLFDGIHGKTCKARGPGLQGAESVNLIS
jgi:hypothetical protein